MEYNSTREKLKFPEYGRHVQKLVDFLRTVEDPKEKQAYAEQVVDLMYLVDYQERHNFDNRAKLWKHLFMIAEYDLEGVIPTVGEIPTAENTKEMIHKVDYPQRNPKFRHYGSNVMNLIEKAKVMEDPVKKRAFINAIGSYMKMAYKNWNKEHYVNDEVIKSDLVRISDGDLEVDEALALDFLGNHTKGPSQNYGGGSRKRKRSKDSGRGKGRSRKRH